MYTQNYCWFNVLVATDRRIIITTQVPATAPLTMGYDMVIGGRDGETIYIGIIIGIGKDGD